MKSIHLPSWKPQNTGTSLVVNAATSDSQVTIQTLEGGTLPSLVELRF